ncbi:MAG: tRNA lysidine(34) synthetase TilS, partial [Mucispirillum sp.]|nr:tRNA lysidine(34) synthetase TilS [Mucispirillum sp.]
MTHSLYNDILLQELKKYRDKKILVAFSGGKDSLMLLDFINKQRESLNIYAGACHINHGLRHTAKRDEDFCRLYCLKNNIEFYTYNISEELKNDNIGGTESSARKYRYKYLLQTVKENNYDFLFTAHTYSDDIESFFVDLYTGASLFTLGGIMCENNQIIRPMLNITTEMVNDYIAENNLEPVFDETNNDIKYVRNRIRHKLIPVLYGCGNEFEKSVIKLQKESNRLNEYLYKKVKHVILKQDNIIILKRYSFMELEDMEKEYLLGKVFSLFFRVSKSILNEALSFLNNNDSKRLDLPNGYVIEQSYNSIKIFKKILVSDYFYNKPAGAALFKTDEFQ